MRVDPSKLRKDLSLVARQSTRDKQLTPLRGAVCEPFLHVRRSLMRPSAARVPPRRTRDHETRRRKGRRLQQQTRVDDATLSVHRWKDEPYPRCFERTLNAASITTSTENSPALRCGSLTTYTEPTRTTWTLLDVGGFASTSLV